MSEGVSREELAARLETSELKAEARQTTINGKLDSLADQTRVLLEASKEARTAAINTRWSMMAMGLAMLGIAVVVMSYGQNMLSMAASIFSIPHH